MELEDQRLRGGLRLVRVAGDVDLGAGPRLSAALDVALEEAQGVIVDLEACTFIDSSGLSALMRAAQRSTGPDGVRRLAVHAPRSATVRRVFTLTRTKDLLQVHDDLAGAKAAVRR